MAALILGAGWAAGAADTAGPPRGFRLAPDAARVLARLLDASPAFVSQVDRVVLAGVRVTVEVAAPWDLPRGTDAVSTIVREGQRVTAVRIRLRTGADWVRALPHELEHVLEQLDGVDLAQLAETRDGRVWRTGPGAFESARAVSAGERVSAEVRRGTAAATMAGGTRPK